MPDKKNNNGSLRGTMPRNTPKSPTEEFISKLNAARCISKISQPNYEVKEWTKFYIYS